MPRDGRGRPRNGRRLWTQDAPNNNKWQSDAVVPQPSPEALQAWYNPDAGRGDWEWGAAGDSTIHSDDPHREDKLRWRLDNDHIHTVEYRVRRWQEETFPHALPADLVESTFEPIGWSNAARSNRSKSRSRSRGRQGKVERHRVVLDWEKRLKKRLAEGIHPAYVDMEQTQHRQGAHPRAASSAGTAADYGNACISTHTYLSDITPTESSRTLSTGLHAWIEQLVTEKKYRTIQKTKALAFLELPTSEKVHRLEILSRELCRPV